MKYTSSILCLAALLVAIVNGERLFESKRPPKKDTHGFMGMPLGAEKKGKTDFRDILKPIGDSSPKYLFRRARDQEGEAARPGKIPLMPSTDELPKAGKLGSDDEEEVDEEEQEEQATGIEIEPPQKIAAEEFSSTEEEEEEEGQEEEISKRGGPALFSKTDSMLLGSTLTPKQQESASETEAETETAPYQGEIKMKLGGAEKPMMYKKQEAFLPPLKTQLGPNGPGGKKGKRTRNQQRRQQQQQQQQQQGTGRVGKGKRGKPLFKGSLQEFLKWNEKQQERK